MSYQVNFGSLAVAKSRPVPKKGAPFRIAVLGDFSARANSGRLDTGDALAARKPLAVDCDNLDKVIARLAPKLTLPIGAGGGTVEVSIGSMDDFHPDQLYGNLSIFSELSGLRQRLKTSSTFAKAAKEVQTWAGEVPASATPPAKARSSAIPIDGKLSDFARLLGEPTAPAAAETPIKELMKQIVGPHIVPAKDPRQDTMVAAVDQALSDAMRSVLHHPDFQTLESLWRSVDFLVRRLETGTQLQIVLYDVTAEELAADLSKADALENSGLYRMLVEQPALDAHQGPFSVIIGNYIFEQTPPHAELLGRISRIAAQAPTAFIAGMGADILSQDPKELHPLIKDAWAALRAMPEAACVGLTVPRFMLRLPYGDRTDPIDSFEFEEFTPKTGLRGMLWANSANLAGLLLGLTYTQQGQKMKLGSVMSVGEMPFYYYTDKDGDQIPLPCTERLMTTRVAAFIGSQAFMPVISMKGAPEVRLAAFNSLAGREIAGPWAPPGVAPAAAPAPAPAAKEEPPPAPAGKAAPAPAAAETAAEPAASGDADLDALLAGLGTEAQTKEAEAQTGEVDPDLADLLKDLG